MEYISNELSGDKPLVSIIAITYNHEKYIRDALEGFVNQKTNFKYEIIVHDDASTDSTAEIIRTYAEEYSEIIKPIYQTENQYSKGAMIYKDFIAPVVQGKYIAYCECDDYWCDEHKLQRQVDFLENNPDYVASVHQSIQINCRTNEEKILSIYSHDKDVEIEDVLAGANHVAQLSSLVCKRELFLQRPPFVIGSHMICIFMCAEGKVRFFDSIMSVYRLYSCETSWNSQNDLSNIDIQKEVIQIKKMRLSEFDKYYNGRYHKEIQDAINKMEYDLLKQDPRPALFLNREYYVFLRKEPAKLKIILAIKCFCPNFYNRLRGIINAKK